MRFLVLGRLEARDGTGALLVPTSRKQRVLLAVLLLHANHPVARDRLVDLLWSGAPPKSAVANLHTYVARLRKLLATGARQGGPPRLRAEDGCYAFAVAPDELDLLRFERLVEQGRQALTGGQHAVAAERLTRALGLWRGRPLEDLPVPGDLAPVLARLEDQHLTVIEDCVEARLALGRHADLAAEIRALTEAHPLRERLWTQRMLAEYRAGRRADALASYRLLYRLLDDQLGIRPGEPIQRLHQQILASDPALDPQRPAVVTGPRPAPHLTPPAQPRGRSGPADRAVPRQLPTDVRGFAGRRNELARLDRTLTAAETRGAPAAVCAVSGTAGVGKTALAVHWAHRIAERFPDGQLYVNLRGFDPEGPVMSPTEAVRGFLDALGVTPERIPADLPAQSALYRSLLAQRRVLVVLDNARDAAQVRPLLPGGTGCLTVVTSRSQLAGLVATDGAYPVAVDLPTRAEARAMLAARLGHHRTTAEAPAVDEIVHECARLPLALAIVAARAAINPELPLAAVAAQLRAARGCLEPFAGTDPATDVRAVFSWSYHTLHLSAARLFRLLGSHPGPDVGAPAAASLAGVPLPEVRPLLAALTEAHLLTEHVPGRYTSHDLLRAYATELSRIVDPAADRLAALDRVLHHYLHTAYAAALVLHPIQKPIAVSPPPAGVAPEEITEDHRALAWFTAEQPVLLAAIRQAADHGRHDVASQAAWALADFLQRRGRWSDLADTQRIALAAAQRAGDDGRQADAHRNLAFAYARLRRRDEAVAQLDRALSRYRALGDHLGRGKIHLSLGFLLVQDGRHGKALEQARLALDAFREADDRTGEARALNSYGWCHSLLGDHQQALIHCEQALALQRDGKDRRGAAYTLDSLGYIHHQVGDYSSATTCYEEAIELLREAGDRFYEADVLHHLGDTHRALNQMDAAVTAWRQALTILDELDHPDADTIRAKLGG